MSRSLGFLSTLVLARLLVPADFGLVAMAAAFAAAIDGLAQLGLGDILVRRPENDTRLHDAVFTLQALRALATGAIIALSASFAGSWFDEPRLTPMLWVLGALTVVSGLENVGIVEFQRSLDYGRKVGMLALPRLLQVIATVAAAWATRSYWALLVGIAVGRVSRLGMTYIAHPYRPRIAVAGWREIVGFSFWLWANSMATLVWERCSTFIVGPVFGSESLGVFRVAGDLGLLPVSELIAPISDVLFASLALLERSGSRAAANALPVALALLVLVAPLAISLSAGSGYVVLLLLGTKWRAAQPLVEILAWACLLSPFSYVTAVTLIAQGRVRQRFFVTAAGAAVQIALLYGAALTDRLSLVAAGVVASVAFEAALFVFLLVRGTPSSTRGAVGGLCRLALATTIAAFVVAQTGFAWAPQSYFTRAAIGPLQALVPCLVIGGMVTLSFAAVLLTSWFVAGRPDGPEEMILRLAGRVLPSWMSWKRNAA